MCLLFGLVILGFVMWAVLRARPDLRNRATAAFEGGPGGRDSAEEILRERLARGEIGAEEYARAIRTLKDHES